MDNTQQIKKHTSVFDQFVLFQNGIHWVTYGIYYMLLIIFMLLSFGMMIGVIPGSMNFGANAFNIIFTVLKISVLFQAVWNWGYYAYLTIKYLDKKIRNKNLIIAGINTIIAVFLLMF